MTEKAKDGNHVKRHNVRPPKDLYKNVRGIFIHNNPKLETIQMPIRTRKDKYMVSYPSNGVRRRINCTTHNNMGESHRHNIKRKDSCTGTSLVAQWLRIRLPAQGTRV